VQKLCVNREENCKQRRKREKMYPLGGVEMGFYRLFFNPLNAKLNPICHLLALLGA
jgi:hypothetical protein